MLNVLSWADWISCLQVALSRFQVPYKYFASEINKNAIQITQKNFPETLQIGDIKQISMWKNWVLFYPNQKFGWQCWSKTKFDLFVFGFPCQDLSYAWKMKWLEWDKSSLFFEFVRVLKSVKPLFFIAENVKMKK